MEKQEMDYDQEKQGSPSWTLMLGGSRMLPREVSNKTSKKGPKKSMDRSCISPHVIGYTNIICDNTGSQFIMSSQ
jgi:hypothetical protein